ncbi:hypothetical protein FE257_011237 [Aspergillus nanangensis]|uniref:Uncharacterized protein n=1 Tax=Aspergillus nanangensis TaxID=2582783 RepID=A0AAD4CHU5_ASPNN|nr:hypothetical protein FE257_011237 [Aspergillus nanangensis]
MSGTVAAPNHGNSLFQFTLDGGIAGSSIIGIATSVLYDLHVLDVDVATLALGHLVGQHLQFGVEGYRRFKDALEKHTAHSTWSNLLSIGLGKTSPIRALTNQDSCCRFTALAACLVEVYTTSKAAEIVTNFCHLFFSSDFLKQGGHADVKLPGPLAMKLLMESCTGLLSSANFSTCAETYMSFDEEASIGRHVWPRLKYDTRAHSRGVADPNTIARALLAVAQLAKGDMRKVTLIGVADIGAIAAIAIWLFDLRVAIYQHTSEDPDALRFKNFDEPEEAQLTVIYRRANTGPPIEQFESTIRITLLDITEVFTGKDVPPPNADYLVGGRVSWDHALSNTFGETFESLLRQSTLVGKAVGSAARVFSAIHNAEKGVNRDWLRRNTIHFNTSHGPDLIMFLLRRFPELNKPKLKGFMLASVRISSFQEAQDAFEDAMHKLAELCSCKICCKKGQNRVTFCLVTLTAAILRFGRMLSGIIPEEGLFPKRAGVEFLYGVQMPRMKTASASQPPLDILTTIIESGHGFPHNPDVSITRVARFLFSGPDPKLEDPVKAATAITEDGICYYLDILRDPLQHNPINLSHVVVVPGRIQHGSRLFQWVCDSKPTLLDQGILHKMTEDNVRPPTPKKYLQAIKQVSGFGVELNLTERVSDSRKEFLEVCLALVQDSSVLDRIGPRSIVDYVCQGAGRVTCERNGCVASQLTKESIESEMAKLTDPWPVCIVPVGDSQVTIVNGDHASTLVAYSCLFRPLVARTECLACCARAGCDMGWRHFSVILPTASRLIMPIGTLRIEE